MFPRRVDTEMLDIDAVFGKVEVRFVLALLGRRQVVLIGSFVLILDAVEVEKVRDLAFLEAANGLVLERADVIFANVIVILAPVSERMLAPVWRKPLLEPFLQRRREA